MTSGGNGRAGLFGSMLETLAVLLLTMGTLASAWSVFQAARWNGEQSRKTDQANVVRLASTRASNLAIQKVTYDAGFIAQYAEAVVDGRTDLQQFYRDKLARPEFLPVLEEWAGTNGSRAAEASNFFQNQAYLTDTFAEMTQLDQEAADLAEQATRAGDIADDYILTTVLMAVVLFLGGIASNYRNALLRVSLLALSTVIFAGSIARLVDLPVA